MRNMEESQNLEKRNRNLDEDEVLDETMLSNFLIGKALNGTRLFHYTTYENLLNIINDKRIRLTRLDLLNDKAEKMLGDSMDDTSYYVMSFTLKRESPAMWKMYGKPSGIKLRVDFNTQKFMDTINAGECYYEDLNGEKINLLKLKKLVKINESPFDERIVLSDILYVEKESEILRHGERAFKNLSKNDIKYNYMKGFIKYSAWEYEKERRLRIRYSENGNSPKHIYVGINDELIRDFHITFNPWLSSVLKEEIKKSLNSFFDFDLRYTDSVLQGEVDEL